MEGLSNQPTVVDDVDLVGFLEMLLRQQPPRAELIVCCSLDEFMNRLLRVLPPREDGEPDFSVDPLNIPERTSNLWLTNPTIGNIQDFQGLSLHFCATVQYLQAFLALSPIPTAAPPPSVTGHTKPSERLRPTLAILSPVVAHKSTTQLSGQGLSRTFASAVEAAVRGHQRLVIFEEDKALWDEDVPILNTTVRGVGADERAWVGRTVKVRQVAERFCLFKEGQNGSDKT
ncbi:hypothetical protein K402DRAFT_417579 [Aulographum hederae CBS 113979]|uniref:Uncharacterized protein n=1 Tax=Aulographum hederae CBS 113979 TaxID=1176131 RepID=A0A6G1HCT6_9PEZI|nr:hypothetical protein K402DRAFT_417579 [Aulographum hederae CBS 113979]